MRDVVRAAGLVSQDIFLFHGTVKENIRYGTFDAADEEVEEAARLAEAHDFIMALPEGYDTVVGERGQKLSGGQRQDRKSTRLNSSHVAISYAVFCLKKKNKKK